MAQGALSGKSAVRKYLDCSTGMLPEEEFRALEAKDGPAGYPFEYGFMLHVPHGDDDGRFEKLPHVKALVALARSLDCYWIMFDQDSEHIADFPTFDW